MAELLGTATCTPDGTNEHLRDKSRGKQGAFNVSLICSLAVTIDYPMKILADEKLLASIAAESLVIRYGAVSLDRR